MSVQHAPAAVGVTLHHVPFLARHHMYMVGYSPHTCLLAGHTHTHTSNMLSFSHTPCVPGTHKNAEHNNRNCNKQHVRNHHTYGCASSSCAVQQHTNSKLNVHITYTITLHQLHRSTDRVQHVPGFSTANTFRSSLTATTYPLKTARLSVTAEPVHSVHCRAEHTHCHNFPPLGQNCKPKLPQDSPDSQDTRRWVNLSSWRQRIRRPSKL
jgi:hypothetical protein